MEVDRPKTAQSSRKGKRAWRKNVDIEDVEVGLYDSRERKRLLGDEEDFVVDASGDDSLRREAKVLKARDILTNKSKTKPLLVERNNRKVQGVKMSEVHRLMKLSGRVQGETTTGARIEKDGIIRAISGDIWGEDLETPSNEPEILKKFSTKGITKAKRAPSTIQEKPIKIDEIVKLIDAGKSYNPSLKAWKKLINKEFKSESAREEKRQELEEFQSKIRLAMSMLEEDSDESSAGEESEEVEENIETDDLLLSVNKPTVRRKKTKAIRNKELRYKQRLELENQYKELKMQIHELSKLDEIDKQISGEKIHGNPKRKSKKQRKLFKYDLVQAPLDVQLSDELTNNLRSVKTEGNLFYDQMKNLQTSGMIEARVPVSKKRKYSPKVTEKWTYKDFK
ncbi:uncharacterized protein PRCAT00004142001 [Priceomyces carsonii]|uniref:uncharacterized protein n=1 Tax=Priceomyces carsonii TaxID=28549 RepID=UPI002ED8F6A4|nr:unnamed protein product [Priceomyces carsonii]